MDIPFKYLGLPIGDNPRRQFKIPKKVEHKIMKIQHKFLWREENQHKKIAWISWDKIYHQNAQDGLGIKDITLFNKALLGKWRWSMFHNKKKTYEETYWNLNTEVRGNKDEEQWFERLYQWNGMDGQKTLFWEDPWLDQEPLATIYPKIYLNSTKKQTKIHSMGHWNDGEWNWDFKWRRNWLGKDFEQWEDLQRRLQGLRFDSYKKDYWKWLSGNIQGYTVKSTYGELLSWKVGSEEVSFLKELWSLKIPPKAKILTWRMYFEGLPTIDNLKKRNI
uniref:Ribonuclease H protein At1g65750 family n=1 Tax=Cajanus cajan TaxID=3821 RepID=A0A151T6J7_CAJCA|nr:Putative ribonuclease H protein At1g65750 family [Cajanus cajan]